jgi:DNA-binding NtrC family response regulator
MTEKILVVDDQSRHAEVLADLLRSAGYDVETCTDGNAAVALASAAGYGVVISDIVMPGLSGLKLLSLIRTRTPAPEVILFTGFGTRERAQEALELGAFAYLEKPFDSGELLERVREALWKRKLSSDQEGNHRS